MSETDADGTTAGQAFCIEARDGKVWLRNLSTRAEAVFPPGTISKVFAVFGATTPQGRNPTLVLQPLALLAAHAPRRNASGDLEGLDDAWVRLDSLKPYRRTKAIRNAWSQLLSWLKKLQKTNLVDYEKGDPRIPTQPRARLRVPFCFLPDLPPGDDRQASVAAWLRRHAASEYWRVEAGTTAELTLPAESMAIGASSPSAAAAPKKRLTPGPSALYRPRPLPPDWPLPDPAPALDDLVGEERSAYDDIVLAHDARKTPAGLAGADLRLLGAFRALIDRRVATVDLGLVESFADRAKLEGWAPHRTALVLLGTLEVGMCHRYGARFQTEFALVRSAYSLIGRLSPMDTPWQRLAVARFYQLALGAAALARRSPDIILRDLGTRDAAFAALRDLLRDTIYRRARANIAAAKGDLADALKRWREVEADPGVPITADLLANILVAETDLHARAETLRRLQDGISSRQLMTNPLIGAIMDFVVQHPAVVGWDAILSNLETSAETAAHGAGRREPRLDQHRTVPVLVEDDLKGLPTERRKLVLLARDDIYHAHDERKFENRTIEALVHLDEALRRLTGTRVDCSQPEPSRKARAIVHHITRYWSSNPDDRATTSEALLLLAGIESSLVLRHYQRFGEEYEAMKSLGAMRSTYTPLSRHAKARWAHVLMEAAVYAGRTSEFLELVGYPGRDPNWRELLPAEMEKASTPGGQPDPRLSFLISLMLFEAVDGPANTRNERVAQARGRLQPFLDGDLASTWREAIHVRDALCTTGRRRSAALETLKKFEAPGSYQMTALWKTLLDAARADLTAPLMEIIASVRTDGDRTALQRAGKRPNREPRATDTSASSRRRPRKRR
ncbi:MAG: hypothetical protein IT379_14785 [Deltaproteobacteria bacterium]|nr:hypothetical protein [Deltaproteobacteria bacterium]